MLHSSYLQDDNLGVAAGLAQLEQGQQQRAKTLPVQGGELGLRLQLPELGHHVPRDLDVLAPVEMLLHGAELEPADLITLLRNVNLVQDVSFARPP